MFYGLLKMAYSADIRRAAIQARLDGLTVEQVKAVLGVAKPTIDRWMAAYRNEGRMERLPPSEGAPLTYPLYQIEAYFNLPQNQGKLQKEMAEELGVCVMTIAKWQKKLGITRKKRPASTAKLTKASAAPTLMP